MPDLPENEVDRALSGLRAIEHEPIPLAIEMVTKQAIIALLEWQIAVREWIKQENDRCPN